MRNKLIISAMVLVFAAGALWGQFWKSYSDKDRQATAQAYWLAGRQYQAVGKADKGRELMQLARVMDPRLDPTAITDQAMPSAAELLARGGASPMGGEAAEVPVQSLNSFFLRFIGAMLDSDAAAATEFMDGSVYLTKTGAEISRSDAKSALEQFFSAVPLAGKTPSDLYDLNSVAVQRMPPAMSAVWGDAYTLRVDSRADYSQYLAFWEGKQQFSIHRVAGEWYIFAIGQSSPPLTWKPQAAPPGSSSPAASGAAEAEASKAIMDTFGGWLGALLKKDVDGALTSMTDSIAFLRLRQAVTKAELKTSLEGSLENGDFGASQVGDAVAMDNAFVERAQSPVTGVSGTVYSLSVQAKSDLSRMLPFWTARQRYYFVNDNGQWKIFALM